MKKVSRQQGEARRLSAKWRRDLIQEAKKSRAG